MDFSDFSPEFILLLSFFNEKPLYLEKDIDWEKFLRLVFYHKMSFFVLKKLEAYYEVNNIKETCFLSCIPDFVFNRLKNHRKVIQKKVLLLSSEMLRLIKLFTENGIDAVVLKGPLLSLDIYQDFLVRESKDIDLLIGIPYLEKAHQLLNAVNYERYPLNSLTKKQWNFFVRHRKDFTYLSRENGVELELHWRVTENIYSFPATFEDVFCYTKFYKLGDKQIRILEPEMNFLYLCIHGYQTFFHRFFWVKDLAVYLKKELDFEKICALAEKFKVEKELIISLLLVDKLCGSHPFLSILEKKYPKEFHRLQNKWPSISQYISKYQRRIESDVIYKDSFIHLARPNFKFKAKLYQFVLRLYPAPFVFSVRVPEKLFFLYFLIRYILWAEKARKNILFFISAAFAKK